MVNLIVGFPIWRRPIIFADVAMREHSTFDCENFICRKVLLHTFDCENFRCGKVLLHTFDSENFRCGKVLLH
jgi:hypothetical protein